MQNVYVYRNICICLVTSYKSNHNISYEQLMIPEIHKNYFDNVADHIRELWPTYLAQIAGTPADSSPPSKDI